MSKLGRWLVQQIERQGLTQGQVAVYSGVSQATISDIINKEHIPRVELLFKLADYFNVSRPFVLRLAGYLNDEPLGFEGVRPEIKEAFYELSEIWDDIAEMDPSGEALRELLTVVQTQAGAFRAAMRAMERYRQDARESQSITSGE